MGLNYSRSDRLEARVPRPRQETSLVDLVPGD